MPVAVASPPCPALACVGIAIFQRNTERFRHRTDSRQDAPCVKFIRISNESAFLYFDHKLILVYIPILDFPIKGMQTSVFLSEHMLLRLFPKAVQIRFSDHMQQRLRNSQQHFLVHMPHEFICLFLIQAHPN